MEVFTQFSSDLDKSTKDLLDHGHRLVELLKQPLYNPMNLHREIISLCAANSRMYMDVPVKELKQFQSDMLDYIENAAPDLVKKIDEEKVVSDEMIEEIKKYVEEFKSR